MGGRRPPPAPDAAVIRTLAGLLAETGLTEIEYAVGDTRIRVARGPSGTAVSAPVSMNGAAVPPATNGGASHEPHVVEKPATNGAANGANHPGTLTSPIVGIAYLAAEPGAAPFARVGDTVAEGQTLLIIEAMKVMNQIRAPRAGRVTRIFIEDAAPVEYGAPLMLIE
ncbi:MAG: acetyl-CoA carboxylase biotin carboxyl carrier protein [Alphaproteobacteria bacterium]|nr:acetyl-CoA carboxylase biotin carboxyl carrier protein [Alphaproteobacteria bacterium]